MPCGLLNVLLVLGVDVRRDAAAVMAPDATSSLAKVRRSDAAIDVDASGKLGLTEPQPAALVEAGAAQADTPVKDECPLEDKFTSNGKTYADANPRSGKASDERVVLGFQADVAQACETCGYTGSSAGGHWTREYGYNYLWNAEVGLRSFWAARRSGSGKTLGWFESCPEHYERAYAVEVPGAVAGLLNYVSGDRTCKLPDAFFKNKFLGEDCEKKEECTKHLSKYLDMTCAPTSNDPAKPELKCMVDEEASGAFGALSENICECGFGELLFCENDETCHGNMCVLSTYDMKKHCKATDESTSLTQLVGLSEGQCSNCRASKNPCEHPDGGDIWTIDTSAKAIAAKGAVMLKDAP